ncbi:hypothetical protein TNCV_3757331 [Trichonephila clavipes]|nr:hypothetical protein TNCV_3757331 [Trichonephila clavipes]
MQIGRQVLCEVYNNGFLRSTLLLIGRATGIGGRDVEKNIDENGSQREEPVGRRVYVGFGTIWGNVLLVMWFRKGVVVEVGK